MVIGLHGMLNTGPRLDYETFCLGCESTRKLLIDASYGTFEVAQEVRCNDHDVAGRIGAELVRDRVVDEGIGSDHVVLRIFRDCFSMEDLLLWPSYGGL